MRRLECLRIFGSRLDDILSPTMIGHYVSISQHQICQYTKGVFIARSYTERGIPTIRYDAIVEFNGMSSVCLSVFGQFH